MSTPENEPYMNLDMDGKEFRATRDNTTLFQFFGRLAMYDHIFVQTGEEGDAQLGAYIFSNFPRWTDMVDYMVTNEYPQHVCLRSVADCDVAAFDRANFTDLAQADGVPEEWLGGES